MIKPNPKPNTNPKCRTKSLKYFFNYTFKLNIHQNRRSKVVCYIPIILE